MAKTTEASVLVDEAPPCVILVVSRDVYKAVEVAVEVAFDDPTIVPLALREAASELLAAFRGL